MGDSDIRARIEEANTEALRRMLSAQPVLVDVMPLSAFDPSVTGLSLTHSGPPVTWARMSGAQRGAVYAAASYEGWAASREETDVLAASGRIRFIPNHALRGVGPMAGVVSPSMHVWVVQDKVTGKCSYSSTEYDAFFGAYDDEALDELRRWNRIIYPAIGRALRSMGGLELKPLMTQALTMGDELHSRQVAASALLAKRLAAAIVRTSSVEDAAATLTELAENELTFLPVSMAACKVTLLAAEGIPYCTVVTAMARNGTDFGIRVSSLGDRWFVAPAPDVQGVFFPGYGPGDAGPDIGDSAITETNGLGAFAAAAAPAIAGLVGSSPSELIAYSREMRAITVGTNPNFGIPQLDFEGTATGIDLRKVVQTGIAPIIDTASAHKDPGHRIVGAGTSRAPLACFQAALEAWAKQYLHQA